MLVEVKKPQINVTAADEQAAGDYFAGKADGAIGVEIRAGSVSAEYLAGVLDGIREEMQHDTGFVLSIRWLSRAYVTGGFDC